MKEEKVVLVNERDEPIGTMEKMRAHREARLHRAFSVFVFNNEGETLLQQRADHKYHSPGLWTNTCCSHPREGEPILEAGKRRLQEEMGFQTDLAEKTSFIYKAPFDNGLTEYEFDHVLTGEFNEEPKINPEEVKAWRWVNMKDLREEIAEYPEHFTVWFRIIFDKYYESIS